MFKIGTHSHLLHGQLHIYHEVFNFSWWCLLFLFYFCCWEKQYIFNLNAKIMQMFNQIIIEKSKFYSHISWPHSMSRQFSKPTAHPKVVFFFFFIILFEIRRRFPFLKHVPGLQTQVPALAQQCTPVLPLSPALWLIFIECFFFSLNFLMLENYFQFLEEIIIPKMSKFFILPLYWWMFQQNINYRLEIISLKNLKFTTMSL